MAGKQCVGKVNNNAGHFRESRAYCEGINFRAQGTALGFPITANPHEFGSEAQLSWDLGWNVANAGAGGTIPPIGCCAGTGVVLV